MKSEWIKAEKIMQNGGLVVLPTDTLYGLCASAFNKKAIVKIYKIKERNKKSPLIVLITSLKDLVKFNIKLDKDQSIFLGKIWPGAVSILISCKSSKYKYIHRGTKEIAFRMIGEKNKKLFHLIKKVGPIVAPSANKESFTPAETIKEAKMYFGDEVDLYLNGGKRTGAPSTLVRVSKDNIEILRQGIVKINIK